MFKGKYINKNNCYINILKGYIINWLIIKYVKVPGFKKGAYKQLSVSNFKRYDSEAFIGDFTFSFIAPGLYSKNQRGKCLDILLF